MSCFTESGKFIDLFFLQLLLFFKYVFYNYIVIALPLAAGSQFIPGVL